MSTEQTDPPGDRVVVGVDGSEQSKHALRWGRFLAHTTGATREAVAAWAPPTCYGFADAGIQLTHVRAAAQARAPLATENDLLICHGNGPQVGVLADIYGRPDASLRQLGLICAS